MLSFSEILFSFSGRIPRSAYWVVQILMFLPAIILGFLMGIFANNGFLWVSKALYYGAILFSWWIGLAILVKRWHDRDKSGFMVFILLIPVIGFLWTLIEVGFLPGTVGPNRYGQDQLDVQVDSPVTKASGADRWICQSCGTENSGFYAICDKCMEAKS